MQRRVTVNATNIVFSIIISYIYLFSAQEHTNCFHKYIKLALGSRPVLDGKRRTRKADSLAEDTPGRSVTDTEFQPRHADFRGESHLLGFNRNRAPNPAAQHGPAQMCLVHPPQKWWELPGSTGLLYIRARHSAS